MKTLFLSMILAAANIQASIENVLWELNYRSLELHCEYYSANLEDRQRIIGKIEGLFEAIELIEQEISN